MEVFCAILVESSSLSFCRPYWPLVRTSNSASSALPHLYLFLVKTYRRFNGTDRTSPSTMSETTLQSLFGNPNITDLNSKPFYSHSMATAVLCTVGDLRENTRWKEIAKLQQRYQVGPYFLRGFVRKLLTAIPAICFTLTDTEATPLVLSIYFHLRRRFLFHQKNARSYCEMPRFHTTSRRQVNALFLIGELVVSLLHFSGCKAEHPIFSRYFLQISSSRLSDSGPSDTLLTSSRHFL